MMKVEFFEKRGCINNRRQKEMLRACGYEVLERDLLREAWSAETLRPFFGARPVDEWFNPWAPDVKSGAVRLEDFDDFAALAAMISNPLLIRRPLLRTRFGVCAGFEPGDELQRLGIHIDRVLERVDVTTCKRGDGAACEEPAP